MNHLKILNIKQVKFYYYINQHRLVRPTSTQKYFFFHSCVHIPVGFITLKLKYLIEFLKLESSSRSVSVLILEYIYWKDAFQGIQWLTSTQSASSDFTNVFLFHFYLIKMNFSLTSLSEKIIFIWNIILSQYSSHLNTSPLDIDTVRISFNMTI